MTAVEWLFQKYSDILIKYTEGRINNVQLAVALTEAKHKALDMEKEQSQVNILQNLTKSKGIAEQDNSPKVENKQSFGEVSDEDILIQSWKYEPRNKFDAEFIREAFKAGMKQYREQIKNKNI